MADEQAYKGAYCGEGSDSWHLTNDAARLAETPDDRVIWADNPEALHAALAERYPCDPPLTRVKLSWTSCYVYDHPLYDGSRADAATELLQHLRQYGSVVVENNWHLKHSGDELLPDVIWKNDVATLDPKKAAAARRRQEASQRKKHVTVYELYRVINAAVPLLRPTYELATGGPSLNDRASHVHTVIASLTLLNLRHGRSAHRKLAAFQDLVRAWKERQEASGKVFREAGLGSFADLMDREAQRRLPPARTDKDWPTEGKPLQFP